MRFLSPSFWIWLVLWLFYSGYRFGSYVHNPIHGERSRDPFKVHLIGLLRKCRDAGVLVNWRKRFHLSSSHRARSLTGLEVVCRYIKQIALSVDADIREHLVPSGRKGCDESSAIGRCLITGMGVSSWTDGPARFRAALQRHDYPGAHSVLHELADRLGYLSSAYRLAAKTWE